MTPETTYISSKGEEKDVTTLDASYLLNALVKARLIAESEKIEPEALDIAESNFAVCRNEILRRMAPKDAE